MKVELLTPAEWFPMLLSIVERCGRVSHKSDMSDTEEDQKKFLKKLLHLGHWSVFEHGCFTVLLSDVSRGLTHELVRHRHLSFIQQSTRYVNPGSNHVFPDLGVKTGEVLYHLNKIQELTSDLPKDQRRQFYPIGTATTIAVTGNFRAWHHVFELRTTRYAHQEIRDAMTEVLKLVQPLSSPIYDDFVIDHDAGTVSRTDEYKPA